MKLIKFWWKSALALFCMLLFLTLFYYFRVRDAANVEQTYEVISASEDQIEKSGTFSDMEVMEQTVLSARAELSSFSLMFRKTEPVAWREGILVELADEEGILQTWNVPVANLVEYQYQDFYLNPPLKDVYQKPLTIRVHSRDLGILAPAVANYDADADAALSADGQEFKEKDMVFMLRATHSFLKDIYLVFSLLIFAGTAAFCIMLRAGQKRLEEYFLVFGLLWGSVFLLLFPPNTAPDEHAHIATVYRNASQILGKETVDADGLAIVRETDANIANRNQVSLESYLYYYESLWAEASDERVSYDYWPLNVPFLAHLPQTLGVVIGWLFHANGMITLYLGKLFGLLFYLLCCYFAVRWIPWGKLVLAIIALLPMSLELAGSFSYDCTVNGLCFLFTGYVMKLIYEKKTVKWTDYAFLAVISAWMAPCKMAYLFVCALVFLVPASKSKEKWRTWAWKGAIVGVGAALILLQRMHIFTNLVTSQSVTGSGAEVTGYTLAQIVRNPVHSLGMLFNTWFDLSDYLFGTIFGQSLGWFQVKISWFSICGFVVLLVMALIGDIENRQTMTAKQRLTVIALSVIMTGGIVLSMWLDFTPDNCHFIAGIQGRYFLPFLPMLLLTLKGNLIAVRRNIDREILIGLFAFELLTVLDVWQYAVV